MAFTQLPDPQLLIRLLASKYYMLASVGPYSHPSPRPAHSPTVILYFDYFLTFDLEVRQLWKKPFTGPTVLFLFISISVFITIQS